MMIKWIRLIMYSTFNHKVTSSVIIILKIEVRLDSHWELQFQSLKNNNNT